MNKYPVPSFPSSHIPTKRKIKITAASWIPNPEYCINLESDLITGLVKNSGTDDFRFSFAELLFTELLLSENGFFSSKMNNPKNLKQDNYKNTQYCIENQFIKYGFLQGIGINLVVSNFFLLRLIFVIKIVSG